MESGQYWRSLRWWLSVIYTDLSVGERGGERREGEFHFIVPLYERSINISKDEDKIHSYLFVRFARVFFLNFAEFFLLKNFWLNFCARNSKWTKFLWNAKQLRPCRPLMTTLVTGENTTGSLHWSVDTQHQNWFIQRGRSLNGEFRPCSALQCLNS